MSMMNMGADIHSTEYERTFWDVMRGKEANKVRLSSARDSLSGTFSLPHSDKLQCESAIKAKSVFRNLATVLSTDKASKIYAYDFDSLAAWIPEGTPIPMEDLEEDFEKLVLGYHKLTILTKVDNDFVFDAGFDFKSFLIKKLAKAFANAEDTAFVNGTGVNMPTGILADEGGADIGITTSSLSYEDIVKLYFSVDKEYRDRGIWMMNDETAQHLRTLKDEAGNYIWNQSSDTILGKRVVICNAMPSVSSGAKPIVFGDFSYYWIVSRKPVAVRTLSEKFIANNQTGYLANEFMDARLIRSEAVKAVQIA